MLSSVITGLQSEPDKFAETERTPPSFGTHTVPISMEDIKLGIRPRSEVNVQAIERDAFPGDVTIILNAVSRTTFGKTLQRELAKNEAADRQDQSRSEIWRAEQKTARLNAARETFAQSANRCDAALGRRHQLQAESIQYPQDATLASRHYEIRQLTDRMTVSERRNRISEAITLAAKNDRNAIELLTAIATAPGRTIGDFTEGEGEAWEKRIRAAVSPITYFRIEWLTWALNYTFDACKEIADRLDAQKSGVGGPAASSAPDDRTTFLNQRNAAR